MDVDNFSSEDEGGDPTGKDGGGSAGGRDSWDKDDWAADQPDSHDGKIEECLE